MLALGLANTDKREGGLTMKGKTLFRLPSCLDKTNGGILYIIHTSISVEGLDSVYARAT